MADSGQRYQATHERNCMNRNNWFNARHRKVLNTVVHCRHGLDPNCPCVKNFLVDKTCPLTEKQAKVGAASFLRSEIEQSGKRDSRYFLLTKIIKCDEDQQDSYIRQYETKFGPLLTDDLFEIDSSIAHLKSLASVTETARDYKIFFNREFLKLSDTEYCNSSSSLASPVRVLDLCQLGEPVRKIERTLNRSLALTANDQYMLIHNASHLCLINAQMKVVRQIEWTIGTIDDSCWNTKLNQIFLIVKHGVFIVDPETLAYKQILGEKPYRSCTCSPKILYLTIHTVPEVLAHSLADLHSPKSVFTCPENMCLEGICCNADKLAIIMNTRGGTPPSVDILSTPTYACLFSITIPGALGLNICGISSLGSSGWLINDPSSYHIFHITEKNTLRATSAYDYNHPYNAIRFGAGYLVVVTNTSINLHKLKFVAPEDLTPSAVLKRFFDV